MPLLCLSLSYDEYCIPGGISHHCFTPLRRKVISEKRSPESEATCPSISLRPSRRVGGRRKAEMLLHFLCAPRGGSAEAGKRKCSSIFSEPLEEGRRKLESGKPVIFRSCRKCVVGKRKAESLPPRHSESGPKWSPRAPPESGKRKVVRGQCEEPQWKAAARRKAEPGKCLVFAAMVAAERREPET